MAELAAADGGAPQELYRLVERFADQVDAYRAQGYNETQLRREYLDPLFTLLGWDMDNSRGLAEAQKEVIHEDSIKMGGATKAPDYAFRVGGERRFFVEAKKPSLNVRDQLPAAYQLRRYAWSAKLPISILTDFEEFAIYDGRVAPEPTDTAATARLMYFTFDQYVDLWPELSALLSREAVLGGSLDIFLAANRAPRGTAPVDAAFLREIESWRVALAEQLAADNPSITQRELNYAVQVTIDRIIFLRICEDRGIEDYGQLERVAELDGGLYAQLLRHFDAADERYNSGLFHFREERDRGGPHDDLTPGLNVRDEVLRTIISALYYPRPYEFAVIPAEILGQVYEQFLGQVISLSDGHEASVEEKPEVKKAGGVYYTPAYIVDFIVERTVGGLVDGRRPRDVSRLRVVDPACGSGSFLLGAYEYLLEWHRSWYVADGVEKHAKVLYQGPGGEWRLTTAERKRILLNNIYGVDIDAQAVEVTKLSLLLKVLENETSETLNKQLSLLRERALPDLDSNIRAGNALVADDFYVMSPATLFDEDARYTVNVFSWEQEFPAVMSSGGFDALIGNPPWLMAGYYVDQSLDYLRDKYATSTGKFDLYYLFLERALKLVNPKGRIGMIVPNKFFHTGAAESLRLLLADTGSLREVVDFQDSKIFAGATNYSCVLFLEPKGESDPIYNAARAGLIFERTFSVPRSTLQGGMWLFHDDAERALFAKLRKLAVPLSEITDRFGTGVQSGADTILLVDEAVVRAKGFERDFVRPVLRGRDVRRYGLSDNPKMLLFPYRETSFAFEILDEDELTDQAPNIYAWLDEHKPKLAKRVWFGKTAEELSGAWYGLVYVDSARSFSAPHILAPSLSNVSNFAEGNGDLFATGTAGVTSVIPREDTAESIGYLLAVLNSRMLSYFAVKHSPLFSGGYYKFSGPYLKHLPIRRIDFQSAEEVAQHDELVSLSERASALTEDYRGARAPQDKAALLRQLRGTQRRIDEVVASLYELTSDERELLDQHSDGF